MLTDQHGHPVQCEMCGAITQQMYRRKAGPLRQGYEAVCRNCLRYHFSPTTIVNDHARADEQYEWTPVANTVDRIIDSIKTARAARQRPPSQ